MMIRALELSDVEALKVIHERYYKSEFELPDYFNKFISAFAVVDDNEKIITAGGIRPIAEVILETDKSYSVMQRREALVRVLDAATWLTGKSGFDQIHAFVQDKTWKSHLAKFGFKPCKGDALYRVV